MAKENVDVLMEGVDYEVTESVDPKKLEGKKYRQLFDWKYPNLLKDQDIKNIYTIQLADFVVVEDGTGVVHIAPAFGEDDMNLGKEKNLPFIQHVRADGRFADDIEDFAGEKVKPKGHHTDTDQKIIEYLAKKKLVFKAEEYKHSYPHCWRCDTPLLNYATNSWFVAVTKIKPKMIKLAEKIHWTPGHIKEGRFGNWLEGAKDWSISRQRFWGSVMPIWKCEKECGEKPKVFGSIKELETASGQKINDLHKHIVDKITLPCKCGGKMHRIPDVLDCWFESGSMPYAQLHYDFENKEKFEKSFPAQFIAEGVDQTIKWFYYMHVVSTAVKKSVAYKNVIVNGIVLAEDGRKMSKRLRNFPDPDEIFEKYGADAMRYYLLTSPVMRSEDLKFSEKEVIDVLRNVIMLTHNVMNFYKMYATEPPLSKKPKPKNILDVWILDLLDELNMKVTSAMNNYDLAKASRPIKEFINELSTWYLRRSRQRFKEGDTLGISVFGYVLSTLSKIIAPFTPFLAEVMYKELGVQNKKSVHLEDWPKFKNIQIPSNDQIAMKKIRISIEASLAARAEHKIKVRQPLALLEINDGDIPNDYKELIKEEVNVKEVKYLGGDDPTDVKLDTKITEELKQEGRARELIRQVNNLRRQNKLTINDKAKLFVSGLDTAVIENHKNTIQKATLTESIEEFDGLGGETVQIDGQQVKLKIEKI